MIEKLRQLLRDHFHREVIMEVGENDTPISVRISPEDITAVCRFLHVNKECYFDQLSCLTGVDNGVEAGTMEIIYNLYSIPFERPLMVRTVISRDKPLVETVSTIWRSADWMERETYDLLGIVFQGHPDLRRILLPGDWEGYPLRKDYTHQEYYHGIRVTY